MRGRGLAVMAAVLTWLVPRRVGYLLADLIGVVGFLVLGGYRRAVLANLSQVMGCPAHDRLVRRAARRCFQTSARNFWDLCSLPHTSPGRLLQRVDIEPEAWRTTAEAVARRRGVVIVTAHLGAFDVAGQFITLFQTKPLIPTAQTTSGRIFHVVTWLRRSWGAIIEPPSPGLLRSMITYLRHGGVVGIIGDRDVTHTGLPVTFFGAPTTLPPGPVRLALETGSALIAMFCPREGDRYRVLVREISLQRTGNRDLDLETNLGAVVALLEEHIRRWPEQWVIFERIWQPDRPRRWRRHRRSRPAEPGAVAPTSL